MRHVSYGKENSLNPDGFINNGWSDSIDLQCYADADRGRDKITTSLLRDMLLWLTALYISWTSHKQPTGALSTYKAEYITLSDESREAKRRRHNSSRTSALKPKYLSSTSIIHQPCQLSGQKYHINEQNTLLYSTTLSAMNTTPP